MITCTHPSGTRFEYVPSYTIVKTIRGLSGFKNRDTGGVLITYPDGVKRYISNSWYD